MKKCPLTDEAYESPCPVVTCPYNLYKFSIDIDCIKQSEYSSLTTSSIEQFMHDYSLPQKGLEVSANLLQKAALEFREAMEQPTLGTCPHCGYPEVCISDSLCALRRRAFSFRKERLQGLTPQAFWYSVIHRFSIIPKYIRVKVERLLSSKHRPSVNKDKRNVGSN